MLSGHLLNNAQHKLIMSESSGYESMAEKQVRDKLDTNIDEFIVITKMDSNTEATMEMETAESLIDRNIESNEHTNVIRGNHASVEDYLNSFKNLTEDFYDQSATSVMLDDSGKVKQEWVNEEYSISHGEDDEEEIDKSERASDAEDSDENSDEETIATFVTSTGQQLALYAVEDSEEVFAVAVYSESGEPPTNFQFLMKADVERLIGEGAVRTVKKPQQMKKQTYQGEMMTPRDKEIHRSSLKNSPKMTQVIKNNTHETHQQRDVITNEQYTWSENISLVDTVEKLKMTIEEEDDTGINDDLTYQDILDNSYFLLEQEPPKEIDTELINNDHQEMEDQAVPSQKEEEIVEQSTVQYILCGEDQSDSELTFDEIKKSMQHFDKCKKIKSLLRKSGEVEIAHTEKANSNESINLSSSPEIKNLQTPERITSEKPVRRVMQATVVKHKHVPNALLGRKSTTVESKQTVFIQGSTALICCPISDIEGPMETNCKESLDSSFKIKRPRKQQLTIVNRADSEIIIQPASMVSEDEEEQVTKKRGRRKKHLQEKLKSKIKLRGHLSRRISSHEQQSRIEVIEIDVENDGEDVDDDEEEDEHYQQKRGNIEEIITIEDGKEKGSSDKENEVIMVGDSDDDSEGDKKKGDEGEVAAELQKKIAVPILKCDHCSRSFRQKRALDTHSRVCPKSPNTRRRTTTTRRSSSTRPNEATRPLLKKQYVCKICQEKFDVVVALARHVRSHYKKKETIASVAGSMLTKKKEEIANTNTITMSTSIIAQENKTKRQLIVEQKNKDRLHLYRGWSAKKMSCIDCGRWFASAALLSAHCLHHATKKSEKRIKRCQICKKLFRSRLIYIRHMRMHSNAKQLQKRIKRTRQSTTTITTLRKRGRPRKL